MHTHTHHPPPQHTHTHTLSLRILQWNGKQISSAFHFSSLRPVAGKQGWTSGVRARRWVQWALQWQSSLFWLLVRRWNVERDSRTLEKRLHVTEPLSNSWKRLEEKFVLASGVRHFGFPHVWLLEKAMAPHSSTLAQKIPWMEEPGRLQSMGSLRVRHDWATSLSLFTFMHWRRKWQPTPVFLPGESRDGGAWWASVYGVAQSRTRLKQLSSSSMSGSNLAPLPPGPDPG